MTLESNGWMTLVLTLKGTILYISQACRALGYSSTDLVGSSILDICHPSDVANVLRELKSGSSDSVVDIISRFRKSDGKYIWVHNYGSVWTDSGRKCAILTGQIQHIPIVPRSALEVYEGVGDRDLWARISTTGLILAVFSSRKTVLGFGPTELQGTSFQCLLTNENMRQTFESLLGRARLSKTSAADLDISSAAGHTLQTETVLYTSNTPLEERAGCFILQCRIGRKSKPNGEYLSDGHKYTEHTD